MSRARLSCADLRAAALGCTQAHERRPPCVARPAQPAGALAAGGGPIICRLSSGGGRRRRTDAGAAIRGANERRDGQRAIYSLCTIERRPRGVQSYFTPRQQVAPAVPLTQANNGLGRLLQRDTDVAPPARERPRVGSLLCTNFAPCLLERNSGGASRLEPAIRPNGPHNLCPIAMVVTPAFLFMASAGCRWRAASSPPTLLNGPLPTG
jgi:hypothetical protein